LRRSVADFFSLDSKLRRSNLDTEIITFPIDTIKSLQTNPELIKSKIPPLNEYLSSLLQHPVLVVSNDLLLFLDPEATSMTVEEVVLEADSVHNIFIPSNSWENGIVRKSFEVPVELPPNHYLIWGFKTQNHDIHFSVDIDSVTQVPLLKHNSHESPILGTLTGGDIGGSCVLKWTNDSKSKLLISPINRNQCLQFARSNCRGL